MRDDKSLQSRASFPSTHWSCVVRAGAASSEEAAAALSELCATYWPPIYAYVRRLGHDSHDAEELTQEFLTRLIEENSLGALDPRRGRFRAFLAACIRNFVANQRDRERCQKRGGKRIRISLDPTSEEERLRIEPWHDWTPERIFDHRWAMAVLDAARARLRDEFVVSGKLELFEHLECFVKSDAQRVRYDDVARALSKSEEAVKVAVHRLRRRLSEIIREEIGKTVETPEDVDDELRHLMSAIRSGDSSR
jgi:RNA polymerase sigma factor (sigma-70 family)